MLAFLDSWLTERLRLLNWVVRRQDAGLLVSLACKATKTIENREQAIQRSTSEG